jgi:hypothetical protein
MGVDQEYVGRVNEAFQISREELGYVHPPVVSATLTQDEELGRRISRELYRHETRPFFYDGTQETITALLKAGDYFCVWSEDYLIRLGTAGFGDIRRSLPPAERKRLFVRSSEDKHAHIPGLVAFMQANDLHFGIFIDNEEESLQKAHEITTNIDPDIETRFVLSAQSDGSLSDRSYDLPGTTITKITDLLPLRSQLSQSGDRNHLWIADFNYTLVDTHALEQSRRHKVASLLADAKG